MLEKSDHKENKSDSSKYLENFLSKYNIRTHLNEVDENLHAVPS
jgi:hypothetical protein